MKADKILLSGLFVFSCMGILITTVNSKDQMTYDHISINKYYLNFDYSYLISNIDSLDAETLVDRTNYVNIQKNEMNP